VLLWWWLLLVLNGDVDDDAEEEKAPKLGEAILSKGSVRLKRSTVASSAKREEGEGVARVEPELLLPPLLLLLLLLRLWRANEVRSMDKSSDGVGFAVGRRTRCEVMSG